MASSASTTITKKPKRRTAGSKKETDVGRKDDPLDAANDFFWTYTEEPHRTRRIAIIKAHPEVTYSLPRPECTLATSSMLTSPGHQALRPRASNKIRRLRCRRPPGHYGNLAPKHALLLLDVLGRCVRRGRHRQPEPVSGHPRDLAQPCLQEPYCQSSFGHLCQSTNWYPV